MEVVLHLLEVLLLLLDDLIVQLDVGLKPLASVLGLYPQFCEEVPIRGLALELAIGVVDAALGEVVLERLGAFSLPS